MKTDQYEALYGVQVRGYDAFPQDKPGPTGGESLGGWRSISAVV